MHEFSGVSTLKSDICTSGAYYTNDGVGDSRYHTAGGEATEEASVEGYEKSRMKY